MIDFLFFKVPYLSSFFAGQERSNATMNFVTQAKSGEHFRMLGKTQRRYRVHSYYRISIPGFLTEEYPENTIRFEFCRWQQGGGWKKAKTDPLFIPGPYR
jgi:hypothetical protein